MQLHAAACGAAAALQASQQDTPKQPAPNPPLPLNHQVSIAGVSPGIGLCTTRATSAPLGSAVSRVPAAAQRQRQRGHAGGRAAGRALGLIGSCRMTPRVPGRG